MKRYAKPLIVLVCLLAIAASLVDLHCTIATNTSGKPAAFVVCGGVWRWAEEKP